MIHTPLFFALYFSWTTPFVVLFGAKAKKSLSMLSFISNFGCSFTFLTDEEYYRIFERACQEQ